MGPSNQSSGYHPFFKLAHVQSVSMNLTHLDPSQQFVSGQGIVTERNPAVSLDGLYDTESGSACLDLAIQVEGLQCVLAIVARLLKQTAGVRPCQIYYHPVQ